MTGYTDTIRKYAVDDRFTGELPDPDGIGEIGLAAGEAGKRLAVRFMLKVAGDRIAAVRFQVFGCGFTIASCSAAAELAQGETLNGAMALSEQQIDRRLAGLPAERGYCAELALGALRAAVASATGDQGPVHHTHRPEENHGPRLTSADPVYRALLATPVPAAVPAEDRHLFACLVASADLEPWPTAAGLGLAEADLALLVDTLFPGAKVPWRDKPDAAGPPPEPNPDIRALLAFHLPKGADPHLRQRAAWFAAALTARAAHPGHLWVAMGLFERPELSAAIGRLLPSLARANHNNMRWKRYLFKQLCDLGGGNLCKSPDCGLCSDYALCFAPEET